MKNRIESRIMLVVYPGKLNGTVNAPASKAHAQRLLFMAALSESPTLVKNVPDCTDIDTTLEILSSLGTRITKKDNGYYVEPFPKNIPVRNIDYNFNDSATTARITIAISAALGIRGNCEGSTSLQKRRMLSLTSRMALRGVKFTNFSLPCSFEGRLEGGEYQFEGNEGSQNISALLMALPMLLQDSNITLTSPLLDSSFIDITIDALQEFGIVIEKTEKGYHIPGKQFYHSPKIITCENDWGLASLWITAGTACGDENNILTVTNLPKNTHQMYQDVKSVISLLHYDFMSLNIDARSCPEIATLIAALSIVKGANIQISGVPQLKYKETDQMKNLAEIAKTLGQQAVVHDDGIEIIGRTPVEYQKYQVVNTKGDPWVFMSMVLSSVTAQIPFVINDENDANKIYKNFLKDFKSLGGKCEIVHTLEKL